MIFLLGIAAYQYGYLRIQSDTASIMEDQAIKTKTLEKYISLISEKPYLEKKIASLKKVRQAEDLKLIEGQTPSLSAATLQEVIKGIVIREGGTISSERVKKPKDSGNFKLISVRIDAILPDSGALSDILYFIETHTPYLVVKELDVRVKNYRRPGKLVVKLDVVALTGRK